MVSHDLEEHPEQNAKDVKGVIAAFTVLCPYIYGDGAT